MITIYAFSFIIIGAINKKSLLSQIFFPEGLYCQTNRVVLPNKPQVVYKYKMPDIAWLMFFLPKSDLILDKKWKRYIQKVKAWHLHVLKYSPRIFSIQYMFHYLSI